MFYLSWILILFISCTSGSSPIKGEADPIRRKANIPEFRGKRKYVVSGKITSVRCHCGGMVRTGDEVPKVVPIRDYKIYVKKGLKNNETKPIIDSTTTDARGLFRFELPKGNYVLLSKNHLDKSIFTKYQTDKYKKVDYECLKKWWYAGMARLQIVNKNINLNFSYPQKCFVPYDVPCIDYIGPLPP